MPSDAANGNSLAPASPASGASAAQLASAASPDAISSSAFWADLDRRLKVLESIVLRNVS